MTLYELKQAEQSILDLIDESNGEISPEFERRLDELAANINDKLNSYGFLLQQWSGQEAMVAAEIQRLQTHQRKFAEAARRLKDNLKQTMETTGTRKLSSPFFTASICKNIMPTTTYEGNIEDLPDWAKRITVEIDKKAIALKAKAGEPLPSGVTVEHGTHLRIK